MREKEVPGYLTELGGEATVGDVFEDLYARVENEVTALKAARLTINGYEEVGSGIDLVFWWGSVRRKGFRDIYSAVDLLANYASQDYPLAGITIYTPEPEARDGRLITTPDKRYQVRANRAHEGTGDYSLTDTSWARAKREGYINCRLGKLGVQAADNSETEPVGEEIFEAGQALSSLVGASRQRLEIVSDGILANVVAIGSLILGQTQGIDTGEVLEGLGRVIRG